MTKLEKSPRDLDGVGDYIREIFQDLLKQHVKAKGDQERLAQVLGVTVSHVKKMIYKGQGGLDVWAKAFAFLYDLEKRDLKFLQDDLRRKKPTSSADKIWFSIKDELGASEDDLEYLAACTREAFRIKLELAKLKKKQRS